MHTATHEMAKDQSYKLRLDEADKQLSSFAATIADPLKAYVPD